MSIPIPKGLDSRFQDRLGGGEVRLPDSQGDDILHGCRDVKKLTDTGWFQGRYTL